MRKYHRPMSVLVNGLLDAGFRLERLLEPVPDAEWLARGAHDPDETRRPMFVLLRADCA